MPRVRAPLLILIAALVVLPTAVADTVTGRAVGMNLGVQSTGGWDLYHFATPGGTVTLTLSWNNFVNGPPPVNPVLPKADYDLSLWRPGALDDNVLQNHERIAQSWTASFGTGSEQITITLLPGVYVVSVEPFQAQGEVYTLTSSNGDLEKATPVPALGSKVK